MTSDMNKQWRDIRRTSTPLVVVRTPDPAALVARLVDALDPSDSGSPLLQWDGVRGLRPLNEPAGVDALRAVLAASNMVPEQTANPTAALQALEHAPRQTAAFLVNLHLWWRQPEVVQALWNLRDGFLTNRRTAVAVVPLGEQVPAEVQHDVVALDEPMPDLAQLRELVARETANYGLALGPAEVGAAADALCGLSAFTASQAVAMAARQSGVDVAALSAMRDEMVNHTPGLSVYRDDSTFADLAGYEVIKAEFLRLRAAREGVRAVVVIDEGDKAFAGSGADGQLGDSSGTKGDQLGAILTELDGLGGTPQPGSLLMGHPGTGKTAFLRALAQELGVPCIRLDLGAMLSSLVGDSQARVRVALAVIRALSGGRALWGMTANSLSNLPAELRRRFDGMDLWFFDLPTREERAAIWRLYLAKYELAPAVLPASLATRKGQASFDDTDWTGAEIKKACYRAWNFGVDLGEAAASIVPSAVSDAAGVARRRAEAHQRFRSPSVPGAYRQPAGVAGVAAVKGRDVALAAAAIAGTAGVRES